MKPQSVRTTFRNGFTFIELLVVVMILALIFTVGYGNYRDFARRQRVESATRLVKGDLRLAQQQAVSGQKTGANCAAANAELVGYRVRRSTNTSYDVLIRCTVAGSTHDDVIKTINLANDYPNVTITSFNIIFNALAQGVTNPATVTIRDTTLPSAVGTRTIQITDGGEIN